MTTIQSALRRLTLSKIKFVAVFVRKSEMKKWCLKIVGGLAVAIMLCNLLLVPGVQAKPSEPWDEPLSRQHQEQQGCGCGCGKSQRPQGVEVEELRGDELRKTVSLTLGNDDVRKLRRLLVAHGYTPQLRKATAARMERQTRTGVYQLHGVTIPLEIGSESSMKIIVFIKQGCVEEALAETEQGVYIVKAGAFEFLTKEQIIAMFNSARVGVEIQSAPCDPCQTDADCGPWLMCWTECVNWNLNCLAPCGALCVLEAAECMAGNPWACAKMPFVCAGCNGCCTQWQGCCGDLPAP